MVYHSPLNDTTFGHLEVRFAGYSLKALVDAVDAKLQETFLALGLLADDDDDQEDLPHLRLEQGYWKFATAVSQWFYPEIMVSACLNPLAQLGYVLDSCHSDYTSSPPSESQPSTGRNGIDFGANCVRFTIPQETAATLGGSYRIFEATSTFQGGNMAVVVPNPRTSLVLRPDSCFSFDNTASAHQSGLVIGVGWDAGRDMTYEMIHGPQKPPDVDLSVVLMNRFGEQTHFFSPKGERSFPGLNLSVDATTGEELGDDERCVFQPNKFPPYVSCAVLVLNLINAHEQRDHPGVGFSAVRNTYARLLDLSKVTEIEVWRLPLSRKECHKHRRATAVSMLRLERHAEARAGWRFVTLGKLPTPHLHGFHPQPLPKAVIISNIKTYVPSMDNKFGLVNIVQGTSDVYMKIAWKERVTSQGLLSEGTALEKRVLVQTEVQKKVPCPAWVSFPNVSLRIPIYKLYGTLGACGTINGSVGLTDFTIKVYDKDKASADDLIFSTDIDLKPLFGLKDVEHISIRPDHCTTSYPKPKSGKLNKTGINSGFTDSSFKFNATLTLDYSNPTGTSSSNATGLTDIEQEILLTTPTRKK